VTAWDYALYEREQLTGESFEKMEQRFDALVEGAQTAVLPSDGHPDGKPEGMVMLRMPAEKINAFCEKCGVTPGSYLQAAFAETVRRISREEKDCVYRMIENAWREQCLALVKLQDVKTGLWHTLLEKPPHPSPFQKA